MRSRSVIENITSLALVQGAEYLVPLVAIPYLIRVLGSGHYGEIAFARAFCSYFLVLTEFGFNFSGTRVAAIERRDRARLSQLFWEIQSIKLLAAAASVLAVALLAWLVPTLRTASILLGIGLLPVVGSVLYPIWLLQGLELMREAAGVMLVVRFALLGLIFALIHGPDDQWLAAALLMGATPVAGVLSWVLLRRRRAIVWSRPSLEGIVAQTREGSHAFLATASSTLYRSSNAVVLGFLVGPVAVAYYSVAEKIVRAIQELSRPITRATYPRVSAYAVSQPLDALRLLRKALFSIGGLCLVLSIGLFVCAPAIVRALAGSEAPEAVTVLRVMAAVPFIGGLNSVMGMQTMLPFGFAKQMSRFVTTVGVMNLLLIGPLVHLLSSVGASACYLVSESVLLMMLYRFHRSVGIDLIRTKAYRHGE